MYAAIDANRQKSWLLIGLFIGLISAAGWVYGYVVTDSGAGSVVLALGLSVGMTLVSWFAGDRIALATTGATELTDRSTFPTLWDIVENLAITAGIPQPKIYLVEDEAPNAFATGRDPQHSSIAVTTGLLKRLNRTELEGVIAHELSHVKNLDTRVMILVAILVGALSLFGDHVLRFGWPRRREDREESGGNIFLIIGILFLIISPIIGQIIRLAISRRREYLADASGALLTRYPEGLASALEKIQNTDIAMTRTSSATNHLWISEPVPQRGLRQSFSALFSTHPPIEDRIRALRTMISS